MAQTAEGQMLDLIPIGEAALRSGMNRDRLRRLCESGAIGGEIRDGRLHIRTADVERLAAQRRAAAATA